MTGRFIVGGPHGDTGPLPDERSLSIPMAVKGAMAAAAFQARIPVKLIDRVLIWRYIAKISLQPSLRKKLKSKSPMLLAETSQHQFYRSTASYGHFGRSEREFSWEHTDNAHAFIP